MGPLLLWEASRGSAIILVERLPDGMWVLMSREVLERHVQLDRKRNISEDDVRRAVANADTLYRDGRAGYSNKRFASKAKADPYGKVKIKRLLIHYKVCRKWLFWKVAFVCTAVLAKRLPPKSQRIWGIELL